MNADPPSFCSNINQSPQAMALILPPPRISGIGTSPLIPRDPKHTKGARLPLTPQEARQVPAPGREARLPQPPYPPWLPAPGSSSRLSTGIVRPHQLPCQMCAISAPDPQRTTLHTPSLFSPQDTGCPRGSSVTRRKCWAPSSTEPER